MAAWWLWVRTDARRRLRSAVVLALLVAVAGGVVMAAVAGARRNGSAVGRAAGLTVPADVWAVPNEPGFDWDAVRALPEVEAVGEFAVTFYEIEGVEQPVSSELPPASAESAVDVEIPVVVEGRLADPDRVDEVTISPTVARSGIGIGDRLTLTLPRPGELQALFGGSGSGRLTGDRQTVTVVGITKGSFFASTPSGVLPTLAFYRRYQEALSAPGSYVNAVIRLRGGAEDIPALTAHLTEIAGHAVETVDAASRRQHLVNATDLERNALYGFAAAAATAALVLIGQTVTRMVAASAVDAAPLTALGFTRTASALGALPAAASAVGALVAGAVAYGLSGRFPVGVGRRIEPHPGRHADWVVLGPGIAVLVAVAIGGALAVAALMLRRRAGSTGGSRIAARVASTDAPVPVALGVRLALTGSGDEPGVPVRPALVGAVVGVLGVVAAFTFGHGLDRAASDPALFGQFFDAVHFGSLDTADDTHELTRTLASQPEVEMVAEARDAALTIGGHEVPVVGLRATHGQLDLRPVQGRLPSDDDEIALSPRALAALGAEVGDRVRVDDRDVTLTVTGEVYSPQIRHTNYDEGAVMTARAVRRLVPAEQLKFHVLLVRFTEGTDTPTAVARLSREVFDAPVVEPRIPVEDQANLGGVRWVPFALAGFLALLALGAVGHGLASTVRRRRRDLAVLRTLGMTPGQARATVAWQAVTLGVVGLVVGLPAGVAVGRVAWQLVAEQAPMLHVAPLAVAAAVFTAVGTLLVGNVVAAWPAHRAARLRPADVLRAE